MELWPNFHLSCTYACHYQNSWVQGSIRYSCVTLFEVVESAYGFLELKIRQGLHRGKRDHMSVISIANRISTFIWLAWSWVTSVLVLAPSHMPVTTYVSGLVDWNQKYSTNFVCHIRHFRGNSSHPGKGESGQFCEAKNKTMQNCFQSGIHWHLFLCMTAL